MSFYSTLTPEEMTRIPPFISAKCIITTRDSPVVESIAAVSYDRSDGTHSGHPVISTTSSKTKNEDTTDAIEMITKEPKTNGEHNGVNHKFKETNRYYEDKTDNDCCVKCVYFAQQCCECVIL